MKAHIIVGLGFGDEGKGTIVDYLTRLNKVPLVVRHNGGDQAGHNVVLPDGTHHCFSQIGSGSFAGANTLISRFMLWNPISLANEMVVFNSKVDFKIQDKHSISGLSPVITPYHVAANRITEYRRDEKHGSCGRGVGMLASDVADDLGYVIEAKDLGNCRDKLRSIKGFYGMYCRHDIEYLKGRSVPGEILASIEIFENIDSTRQIQELYQQLLSLFNIISGDHELDVIKNNSSIFEGAQGVLLDEDWGFHPNTTWSHCTPKNAVSLLKLSGFEGEIETTGVMRTFMTRHGNGPLVTEDSSYNPDARKDDGTILREHNCHNDWQSSFRVGPRDLVMLDYALQACERDGCKVDNIALTHTDNIKGPIVDRYGFSKAINKRFFLESNRGRSYVSVKRLILPRAPGDLDYLSDLRAVLGCATPMGSDGYIGYNLIDEIEETSNLPVRYTSAGQTHEDKKVRHEHSKNIRVKT